MSGSQEINVAVIGAGVGNNHIAGYRANPDRFRVATVCDLDIEKAQKAAGEDTGTNAVTDFAEVLADPEIDLVDIALPPHIHFSATIDALAAGKHVLCEKPLATSLADVDRMGAAAEKAGKLLLPVFQYRYGKGFRRLEHLIAKGMTGKPFTASLETHWQRGPAYYEVPWRGTWAGEQGGAIVGHAIHIHNLATHLLGPVVRVGAFLDTRVNDIEVEDCGAVAMQMQSGALVTSSITLGSAGDMSRMRLCFEHLTAESSQEPYSFGDGEWTFRATDPNRQGEIDAALVEVGDGPGRYAGLMLEVHKTLTGDPAAAAPSFAEARHSIELITAIYQAQRNGIVERLPLDETHPLYDGWSLADREAS